MGRQYPPRGKLPESYDQTRVILPRLTTKPLVCEVFDRHLRIVLPEEIPLTPAALADAKADLQFFYPDLLGPVLTDEGLAMNRGVALSRARRG